MRLCIEKLWLILGFALFTGAGCGAEGAATDELGTETPGETAPVGAGSDSDVAKAYSAIFGCPATTACYPPLNRVWNPSLSLSGCPCKRAPACNVINGRLVSKCATLPSTCGYLFCDIP